MLRILAPIMERFLTGFRSDGWHYRVHRYKHITVAFFGSFGVADIVNTKTRLLVRLLKPCSFSFFNFLSSLRTAVKPVRLADTGVRQKLPMDCRIVITAFQARSEKTRLIISVERWRKASLSVAHAKVMCRRNRSGSPPDKSQRR